MDFLRGLEDPRSERIYSLRNQGVKKAPGPRGMRDEEFLVPSLIGTRAGGVKRDGEGIPTRWGFPRSELDLIVGGNVSIESDEELLVALHEMKGPLYKLSLTACH